MPGLHWGSSLHVRGYSSVLSIFFLLGRLELDALVGQTVGVVGGEVLTVGLGVHVVVATVTVDERLVLASLGRVVLHPLLEHLRIGLPHTLELAERSELAILARSIFQAILVGDLEAQWLGLEADRSVGQHERLQRAQQC